MDKNTTELGQQILRAVTKINLLLAERLTPNQAEADVQEGLTPARSPAKWYRTYRGWKDRLEFAAYAFAIMYACITYLQWRDANSNFQAGQRAWVLVSALNLTDEIKYGSANSVNFKIKNFGLSPALSVVSHTKWSFEGPFCVNTPEVRPSYLSRDVIAPGQENFYPNSGLIFARQDDPCLIALNDGRESLRVEGVISYRDIFKLAHTTRFCSQYEGASSHQLTSCSAGNEAD